MTISKPLKLILQLCSLGFIVSGAFTIQTTDDGANGLASILIGLALLAFSRIGPKKPKITPYQ